MEKRQYQIYKILLISLTICLLVLQSIAFVFNIIAETGIQLGISIIVLVNCIISLGNLLELRHPTINFISLSIHFFSFILILLFCIPFLIYSVDYDNQCFGDDGDCKLIQGTKYCKIRNRFSVNDSYQECEYSQSDIRLKIAINSIDIVSSLLILVLIYSLYEINKFFKFIYRMKSGNRNSQVNYEDYFRQLEDPLEREVSLI